MPEMFKGWKTVIALLLIFLTGLTLGWFIKGGIKKSDVPKEPPEHRLGTYAFVNPLLECQEGAVLSEELQPFKHIIEEFVEQKIKAGQVDTVSVYFRDLNNGPWFGINERDKFSPASLLKVVTLMGYLKLAESNPGILSKKMKFTGTDFPSAYLIPPKERLKKGKSYTIKKLLERLITYSDNDALWVLFTEEGYSAYNRTFAELGIPIPEEERETYYISIKQYGSFFRILFNASYLNKDMSNTALEMLAKSDFRDGIVAGVPEGITVAHKFGERKPPDQKGQFHDCGIVYYPDRPYLLCVMSRGDDPAGLIKSIAAISGLVYQEVDRQMKGK